MFVRELLERKGRDVKRVAPDQTVEVAAALMRLEQVGALVVGADDDRVAGLFSEKDVVRAIADYGPRALQRPVADVMEPRPVTCGPDDSVARVAAMMTLYRARHVPVVEGGRLVGIMSVGDLVKERLEEVEIERDVLRDLALSRQLAG